MAARDFSVTISAALDGDIDGEEKFVDDPDGPIKGVTVSDAGIMRAPADGDDPSRKRTLNDLSAARAAMKNNARYQVARAVAGQLARNVSDLLERDHVIDETRSVKPMRAEPIPLYVNLWLPARFSKEAIKRTMDNVARAEYDASPKELKDELLAKACVSFIAREITKRYNGGVTAENMKAYVSLLDSAIETPLRQYLPSQVTGSDLQDIVKSLQNKTMVEIGQTGIVPSSSYENLQGGTSVLGPIVEDKVVSGNQLTAILNEWDKTYNDSAIKKRRDEVEAINKSRTEYIAPKDPRNPGRDDEYPKGLAQLPETTQRILFSPALSNALSKTLDAVRRAFNTSTYNLGSTDAVEFVSEYCSESMALLFAEITACYIRIAELSTPRRQESIRDNLPVINVQLSQAFSRLKEQFTRVQIFHPTPKPYYLMRGEGLPEMASRDGDDDALLGVPLVDAGTKRQKAGRLKTGLERAEEVYNKHLLKKYAGV
jgi:hypothetical protein